MQALFVFYFYAEKFTPKMQIVKKKISAVTKRTLIFQKNTALPEIIIGVRS